MRSRTPQSEANCPLLAPGERVFVNATVAQQFKDSLAVTILGTEHIVPYEELCAGSPQRTTAFAVVEDATPRLAELLGVPIKAPAGPPENWLERGCFKCNNAPCTCPAEVRAKAWHDATSVQYAVILRRGGFGQVALPTWYTKVEATELATRINRVLDVADRYRTNDAGEVEIKAGPQTELLKGRDEIIRLRGVETNLRNELAEVKQKLARREGENDFLSRGVGRLKELASKLLGDEAPNFDTIAAHLESYARLLAAPSDVSAELRRDSVTGWMVYLRRGQKLFEAVTWGLPRSVTASEVRRLNRFLGHGKQKSDDTENEAR